MHLHTRARTHAHSADEHHPTWSEHADPTLCDGLAALLVELAELFAGLALWDFLPRFFLSLSEREGGMDAIMENNACVG